MGEDAEVGFGEAVAELDKVGETWEAAGADVTVAGVDVAGGRAEACGKSFTAVILGVVTAFTVVVTAGVALAFFDIMVVGVVIAVVGTDVGTASTAMADDTLDVVLAADVATEVVLAESGAVVFTVVETEGFGSTGALEAVETTSVGFTPGRVEETVLAGGNGVVVVGVPVTGCVTEDAEETWVDSVSGSGAGAELTT